MSGNICSKTQQVAINSWLFKLQLPILLYDTYDETMCVMWSIYQDNVTVGLLLILSYSLCTENEFDQRLGGL